MEVDTINLDEVHKMLGERDIALFKAARKIDAQQQEIQRLRNDLAEAVKAKAEQG